jgi:NADH:ubiquinone oxidoreductase subunit 5 (subunit L)/multisubunit Na+/H+ antiporter MnhA subunit
MVHAGVFLLLRLHPLFAQVPDVLAGIVVVGALTAVYAWLVGLVQTDVKSALVFATVFQVGLMFVAIGLGWTTLATAHLCLHAAWRAWQFLVAPSWLALTQGAPKPAPAWLRRRQWLYTAALQRFWLDRVALALLARPTAALSADVRGFEAHFIDRGLGEPGRGHPRGSAPPLVAADGAAGRLLAATAEALQQVETRLALRGRGGTAERLLRGAGQWLRTVENLLEQPRYLMMAVMATFVVIL